MNKTIRLYGFSKNDELVFTSLISLLSNKTHDQWEIVHSGSSQVVVVDTDKYGDNNVFSDLERSTKSIITYGNRSFGSKYPVLPKPLRAAGILKCLSQVGQGVAKHSEPTPLPVEPVAVVDEAYHLRRWPTSDLIRKIPGATRMSAVLLKEVVSVDQLVERCDVEREQVQEYIAMCLDQGFLVKKERTHTKALEKKDNSAMQPLFARLRAKFSARL